MLSDKIYNINLLIRHILSIIKFQTREHMIQMYWTQCTIRKMMTDNTLYIAVICSIGSSDKQRNILYIDRNIKAYLSKPRFLLNLSNKTSEQIVQIIDHNVDFLPAEAAQAEKKLFKNKNRNLHHLSANTWRALFKLARDYRYICNSWKAHLNVFRETICFCGCN